MEGELSAVVVHAAAVHQAQDVLHGGAVQHLHTTAVSSDQVRCWIEFLCTILTLSPVVGQMPPLARVAAMMAMLSHVISMEQHCR